MIGFFFIGAISTSITRGMKQGFLSSNKAFISSLKVSKGEENSPSDAEK